jgi:hypothetical protein
VKETIPPPPPPPSVELAQPWPPLPINSASNNVGMVAPPEGLKLFTPNVVIIGGIIIHM